MKHKWRAGPGIVCTDCGAALELTMDSHGQCPGLAPAEGQTQPCPQCGATAGICVSSCPRLRTASAQPDAVLVESSRTQSDEALAKWWLEQSLDECAIDQVAMGVAAPALAKLLASVREAGRRSASASPCEDCKAHVRNGTLMHETTCRWVTSGYVRATSKDLPNDGTQVPKTLGNNELRACYGCYRCLHMPEMGMSNPTVSRMIVCPCCGNKRCPRASDHRFACTGSNEAGQDGSFYGTSWEDLEAAVKEARKEDPVWQRLNGIAESVAAIGESVVRETGSAQTDGNEAQWQGLYETAREVVALSRRRSGGPQPTLDVAVERLNSELVALASPCARPDDSPESG